MNLVRRRVADSVTMQRVHAVTEPWTDYVRFEITWSYPPNIAAGEDIRITTVPAPWPGPDFWLFDNHQLWVLHYTPDGHLNRVESAPTRRRPSAPAATTNSRRRATPDQSSHPRRTERSGSAVTATARERLAERLRALRAPRFPSGSALARHLGWQQSKVSRIELGHQLPSRDDLDRWIDAVGGVDAVDPTQLHQLLDEAHVQTVSSRGAARSGQGLPGTQQDLGALEHASTLIAEYQPHLVPGLAQTAAYARAWLTQPDRPTTLEVLDTEGVEDVVRARLARQAILYQPDHRIVIALGEAALRNVHGDPATHRQQLGHLQVLAELPTVELLVEPAATAMATMRGFELLDDRVILEDPDQARHLTDPTVIARFTAALDALRHRGKTGPDAITLIRTAEHAL